MDAQIVVVSHDFSVLEQMERVLVLNNGSILADDSPSQALAAYDAFLDS